jgi:hypothetical protein
MDLLFDICRTGSIIHLISLYNTNPNIVSKFQDAFELACFHGKREILHKLYEWGHDKYIDIHANNDRLFYDALFGPIEILEDIYSWRRSIDHKYDIEKNIHPLLSICQNNRIAVIDKLLNWGLINNLNRYDNLIFRTISGYNCGDMLAKIYNYSIDNGCAIDLSYDNNFVFRNACYYGQLENVKKIYYWSKQINNPIDIHCCYEQSFRSACMGGHLEIMKQLYNWSIENYTRINIRILNEDAFISACRLGNLNIIKILRYWEPEIDIHHENSICFVDACKIGFIDVVIQLYEWTIEDNSLYKLNKCILNAVCSAAKNDQIRILQLLFVWFPEAINYFIDDISIYNFSNYTKNFISNYLKCYQRNWLNNINDIIDQCSICLSEKMQIVLTPCSHKYCKECITLWLMKSELCPLCRRII